MFSARRGAFLRLSAAWCLFLPVGAGDSFRAFPFEAGAVDAASGLFLCRGGDVIAGLGFMRLRSFLIPRFFGDTPPTSPREHERRGKRRE